MEHRNIGMIMGGQLWRVRFRQRLNYQEDIQLKVSNRRLKMQVRSLEREVRAWDKMYFKRNNSVFRIFRYFVSSNIVALSINTRFCCISPHSRAFCMDFCWLSFPTNPLYESLPKGEHLGGSKVRRVHYSLASAAKLPEFKFWPHHLVADLGKVLKLCMPSFLLPNDNYESPVLHSVMRSKGAGIS